MLIQGFSCMKLTFSQQILPIQSPPAMRLRLWRGWYEFPRWGTRTVAYLSAIGVNLKPQKPDQQKHHVFYTPLVPVNGFQHMKK